MTTDNKLIITGEDGISTITIDPTILVDIRFIQNGKEFGYWLNIGSIQAALEDFSNKNNVSLAKSV